MKSKKGVVELQFNWIFILIAGALIVAFFIVIVQKQRQIADVKLTGAIKADLSTILTGSQVSRGTSSLVEIPKVNIHYDCDGYSVGDLGAINPGISFSPDLLKGTSLMMWSLDWNVPFRVDNFLHITSPEVRYIFVIDRYRSPNYETLDKNRFTDLYESEEKPSFPPKTIIQNGDERILFNKELVPQNRIRPDILPSNNYKYRFISMVTSTSPSSNVWLTNPPLSNEFRDVPDDAVTGLNILPDEAICAGNFFDCIGEITFYQKNKNGNVINDFLGESYYFGRSSVIAAVFAERPEHYNCQMRKAFRKLQLIAQIYLDKVNELYNYYDATYNVNCKTIISAQYNLRTIADSAEYLADNFPEGNSKAEIRTIYNEIPSLDLKNIGLQRMSCAEIY